MNERGRLKCVNWRFRGHLRRGEPAQFLVNEGQQFIRRFCFAATNGFKSLCNLAHGLWLLCRAAFGVRGACSRFFARDQRRGKSAGKPDALQTLRAVRAIAVKLRASVWSAWSLLPLFLTQSKSQAVTTSTFAARASLWPAAFKMCITSFTWLQPWFPRCLESAPWLRAAVRGK